MLWQPHQRVSGHKAETIQMDNWCYYASILFFGPTMPHGGVRAHSTRGIASSWARYSGVSIGEIQVQLKTLEYGEKVHFFYKLISKSETFIYFRFLTCKVKHFKSCFCFNFDDLSFNTWPFIKYQLWVSLVLWKHNDGEHCWLGNGQYIVRCPAHSGRLWWAFQP